MRPVGLILWIMRCHEKHHCWKRILLEMGSLVMEQGMMSMYQPRPLSKWLMLGRSEVTNIEILMFPRSRYCDEAYQGSVDNIGNARELTEYDVFGLDTEPLRQCSALIEKKTPRISSSRDGDSMDHLAIYLCIRWYGNRPTR